MTIVTAVKSRDSAMTNRSGDWTETALWNALASAPAGLRATLEIELPKIKAILDHAGTGALDFTLHDASHSYRVAERIAELVGTELLQGLSSEEIALLLLAAYVHDIGMSPEQARVAQHRDYLLTGDRGLLNDADRDAFQHWLDEEGTGIEPPITSIRHSVELLQRVDELIARYARYRHADWTTEWIRANLTQPLAQITPNLLDDLILICEAHAVDASALLDSTFDPRVIGAGPRIVHPRFLAVVLRVADVLEFDPERTPFVIYRHRDISAASQIYWFKDHDISFALEGDRLILSARPHDARIHKAVLETADQVDRELANARYLDDETHFSVCPGVEAPIAHTWHWRGSLHKSIKSADDSYEFIEASFRPDTDKLLSLLTGTALYRSPFAAVREMLQNSFDAVKEEISWQRLTKDDPLDHEVADALAIAHSVDLRLVASSEGAWLVCRDTGIGMSKALIQNQFLVSGTATRHDILELERRCRSAGFSSERTGRFGIGVLSYFMLASRVVIKTRRSAVAGDADGEGWRFETEGVGSFGELRRGGDIEQGTETTLRLKVDIVGDDPREFYAELRKYLSELLTFVPCRFRYSSALEGCETLELRPGWTRSAEQLTNVLISALRPRVTSDPDVPLEQLSAEKREAILAARRQWEALKEEVAREAKWHEEVGHLEGGAGRFRLHYPYFEVAGASTLAYLRGDRADTNTITLQPLGRGFAFFPRGHSLASWRGMTVDLHVTSDEDMFYHPDFWIPPGVIAEIDWLSPALGELTVNRDVLLLEKEGRNALSHLGDHAANQRGEMTRAFQRSPFTHLNGRMIDRGSPSALSKSAWIHFQYREKQRTVEWRDVSFPVITSAAFLYRPFPRGRLVWNETDVNVLPSLQNADDDSHWEGMPWPAYASPGERILMLDDAIPRAVEMWTRETEGGGHVLGPSAEFPPGWKIAAVHFGEANRRVVWNQSHPLVEQVDAEGVAWLRGISPPLDPVVVRDELLATRGRALAWLLQFLVWGSWDLWQGIPERDPTFFDALSEAIYRSPWPTEASEWPSMWREAAANSALELISPQECLSYSRLDLASDKGRANEMFEVVMPSPSAEWIVTVSDPH